MVHCYFLWRSGRRRCECCADAVLDRRSLEAAGRELAQEGAVEGAEVRGGDSGGHLALVL